MCTATMLTNNYNEQVKNTSCFTELQEKVDTLVGVRSVHRFTRDGEIDSRQNHINLDADEIMASVDDIRSARIFPNNNFRERGSVQIDTREMVNSFVALGRTLHRRANTLMLFISNVFIIFDKSIEIILKNLNKKVEVLYRSLSEYDKKTTSRTIILPESELQKTVQNINVEKNDRALEPRTVEKGINQSIASAGENRSFSLQYNNNTRKAPTAYPYTEAVITRIQVAPKQPSVFKILYCELVKGKKYPCVDKG